MSRGGDPLPARVVLAAIVRAPLGIALTCPGCSAAVGRPGPCAVCARSAAPLLRSNDLTERCEARIPAAYRWGSLEPGGELQRALAHVRPDPVASASKWLAGILRTLLIRGETHSYKSTLASACVRLRTEQGRDAYIVHAADLSPEAPPDVHALALRRVRDARALVVLNDAAKVLGGAAPDSGVAAQRRHEFCWAVHTRWEANAKTIVTTTQADRGRGGIVESFGEDILARWIDKRTAMVIELERAR